MATQNDGAASGGTLALRPKTFGLFGMVLFSVSAILVADTVASLAAMGVQGLGFWSILGLLFFIPYGFVTAELGSAGVAPLAGEPQADGPAPTRTDRRVR